MLAADANQCRSLQNVGKGLLTEARVTPRAVAPPQSLPSLEGFSMAAEAEPAVPPDSTRS